MLEQIETILSQLKIDSFSSYFLGQDKIVLPDHSFANLSQFDRRSLSYKYSTSTKPLEDSIAGHLYCGCYMKGSVEFSFSGPPSLDDLNIIPSESERSDFMNNISSRLVDPQDWDKYWEIYHVDSEGKRFARKNNRNIQLQENGYKMAKGFYQPIVGSYVHVYEKKERKDLQPIFYYKFGEQYIQSDLDMIRFYFNFEAVHAPQIVQLISEFFDKYRIPYLFKCLNHPDLYERRVDTGVLFVPKRFHRVVWNILQSIILSIEPMLRKEVPLFTYKLIDGLSFAEDPGDGLSFGAMMSQLISQYIVYLHMNRKEHTKGLIDSFFKEYSLEVEQLYFLSPVNNNYEFIK